jgi:hypothetical protein
MSSKANSSGHCSSRRRGSSGRGRGVCGGGAAAAATGFPSIIPGKS